ncbi:MAG: GNAT family N-acetyltransferase [Bacteroidota bacterium]
MESLKGEHIVLRALEPEDLEFLYQIENDMDIWEISGTVKPYSRKTLQRYLENAHLDIYEIKQLRLCICDHDGARIGFIDMFDFDPKNQRAGLGIVIADVEQRGKGYGEESVSLFCTYAFSHLLLNQIYVNVLSHNTASLQLFAKLGFQEIGIKKEWMRTEKGFADEIMLQKLKSDVH